MQPWPFLDTIRQYGISNTRAGTPDAMEPQNIRLYIREDEAVPVQPVGVLRVELHELVPEDVGNGSHAPMRS